MKILKNTTVTDIELDIGVTVPASGQITISPLDYLDLADSDDIIVYIGSEDIIVNDGSVDLSISEGTDLIKGLFPKKIGITAGTDFTEIGHVSDALKVSIESIAAGATPEDFFHAVQSGMIDGHRIMEAFGERENMSALSNGEDIWRGNANIIPIPADVGEQMTVVSGDNDDKAGDTGVRTLYISYIDDLGNEQSEIVTMNGTTPVDTVATNIRFVQYIRSETVGSNGVADGDIEIYKKGNSSRIYNFIEEGGNMSLTINRMVPLNKTLYLQSWSVSEAKDKRTSFRLRSTDSDGIIKPGTFIFKDVIFIRKNTSGDIPVRTVVPALSIVKVSAWGDQDDAEGSARWWGVLVDD